MIKSLAYVGVNSPRAEDWRRFGTGFLGAELAPDGPDGCRPPACRRRRLAPRDPPRRAGLGRLLRLAGRPRGGPRRGRREARRRSASPPSAARRELAEERNVDRIITFTDPWGFPHEVIWGQHLYPSTFRPGRASSGFVTGDQGLGHVLLLMPDIEAGHEFFSGVLGFELSDKIIVPGALNSRFYHVNARHHTLALGQCPPGVAGFNHLMLQVKDIDDVGTGYDIAGDRRAADPLAGPAHQRQDVQLLPRDAVARYTSRSATTASRSTRRLGAAGLQPDRDLGPPARPGGQEPAAGHHAPAPGHHRAGRRRRCARRG